MSELEEWNEVEKEDVPTSVLDAAVESYHKARAEHKECKDLTAKAYGVVKDAEGFMLELFAKTKKSKYFVDGLGTAYVINKHSVKTPKTVEEKELLFDYIKTEHGEDVLKDYLSINSARLNSFFNEQAELAAERGDADFQLPGVGAATVNQSLGFRKK